MCFFAVAHKMQVIKKMSKSLPHRCDSYAVFPPKIFVKESRFAVVSASRLRGYVFVVKWPAVSSLFATTELHKCFESICPLGIGIANRTVR